MSPEAYSWEVREAAEELYIIDGRTFDQVAETTGVSISQLKRWGLDSVPTWSDRRREYRQAQTSVRRGVMLAKAKLIESVINTEDAQKAYAFSALVSSARTIDQEARERSQQAVQAEETAPVLGEAVPSLIRTSADAVAALQLAVQGKINNMLTRPGDLSFAAIKDTKAALEMIEQLQSKYVPADDEAALKGGLSDEAASAIRRQILGLKN
jgi:hypothetical protein